MKSENNPCLTKADRKFSGLCAIAAIMYDADEAWRSALRNRKLYEITENLAEGVSKETMSNFVKWIDEN